MPKGMVGGSMAPDLEVPEFNIPGCHSLLPGLQVLMHLPDLGIGPIKRCPNLCHLFCT